MKIFWFVSFVPNFHLMRQRAIFYCQTIHFLHFSHPPLQLIGTRKDLHWCGRITKVTTTTNYILQTQVYAKSKLPKSKKIPRLIMLRQVLYSNWAKFLVNHAMYQDENPCKITQSDHFFPNFSDLNTRNLLFLIIRISMGFPYICRCCP